MRKLISITAFLILATITGAATVITYTIPNAKATKILAAFEAQSGCTVMIQIRKGGYLSNIKFDLALRDPNSTDVEFVKQQNGLIAHAFVVAHEIKLRADTYNAYRVAMPIVDVNEPIGIE